jgi:hypothetical protein
MPLYSFDVCALYRTDEILAETEEEAREIAKDELQYCGEERDTTMVLRYVIDD